jgi:hypothetical protein
MSIEVNDTNRNLNFTFDPKVELPDYANANIRAVMSNKFVCTPALFIILFHGGIK